MPCHPKRHQREESKGDKEEGFAFHERGKGMVKNGEGL
jgi:hypothetical protein